MDYILIPELDIGTIQIEFVDKQNFFKEVFLIKNTAQTNPFTLVKLKYNHQFVFKIIKYTLMSFQR